MWYGDLFYCLIKIRFKNKINIEMLGSFEIFESYVGERVNKIRFIGSIKREN